jgi:hypothetical protein
VIYLETVVDCYIDVFHEVASAFQIIKHAHKLFVSFISAVQSAKADYVEVI